MNEDYKHLNCVLHDSNGSLDRVTKLSGVVSVVVVIVATAVVLGGTRYKVHGRSSDVEQGLEHRGPGMVFLGHIIASGVSGPVPFLLACLVTNHSRRALWEGSVVAHEKRASRQRAGTKAH